MQKSEQRNSQLSLNDPLPLFRTDSLADAFMAGSPGRDAREPHIRNDLPADEFLENYKYEDPFAPNVEQHQTTMADPHRRELFARDSQGLSKDALPLRGIETPAKSQATPSRRYLKGRFSKCQFITLCILIGMLIFSIIFLPLLYFVIVPAIIKKEFATRPLDSGGNITPVMQTIALNRFTEQGLDLKLGIQLVGLKLSSSILSGGLESGRFQVSSQDNAQLVEIALSDPVSINGKEDMKFEQNAFQVNFPEPPNTQKFTKSFLSILQQPRQPNQAGPSKPTTFVVSGRARFTLMGITFKEMDLRREQVVDLAEIANMIDDRMNGATTTAPTGIDTLFVQNATSLSFQNVSLMVAQKDIGGSVRANVAALQSLDVKIGKFNFQPTLSGQPLAQVSIQNIVAAQAFAIDFAMAPVAITDDTANRIKSIISGNLDDLSVGVSAISLVDSANKPVGWFNAIVDKLAVEVSASRLLGSTVTAVKTASADAGKNNTEALKAFSKYVKIQSAKIAAVASGMEVTATVTTSIPYPIKMDIPSIGLSVMNSNATQLMAITLPPLSLSQGEQSADYIVVVTLDNADDARTAATDLINQVMKGTSTSVRVGRFQIGMNQSVEPSLNNLLGVFSLAIPLDSLNGAISQQVPALAPGQLPFNATAAFSLVSTGVQGNLKLTPPSLPFPISVDMGQASVNLDVGGNVFCNAVLPTLQLATGGDVNIALDLRFAVKPDVYPKLVTDLLGGQAASVNIGGLAFGLQDKPMTLLSAFQMPFSFKIPIPLPGPKPQLNIIPPSISLQIPIPFPVTADVGTLTVQGLLGDAKAATLTVNQLAIAQGTNPVKIEVSLNLLAGIKGLFELIGGGGLGGTDLTIVGKQGDVTWISQSFAGQRVTINLPLLLGVSKPARRSLATNDWQNMISSYNWTQESRKLLERTYALPLAA
ncbi:hypothetical protein DFS34DRAFT_417265 [Phlyctochytrium arcticum]|nr:hypothetical protein DFS34DRAFT_417265 [Phlyctochytrium arcticum]